MSLGGGPIPLNEPVTFNLDIEACGIKAHRQPLSFFEAVHPHTTTMQPDMPFYLRSNIAKDSGTDDFVLTTFAGADGERVLAVEH